MKFIRSLALAASLVALTGCEAGSASNGPDNVWGEGNGGYAEGYIVETDTSAYENAGEAQPPHPAAEPPRAAGDFGDCARMHPAGLPPKVVAPEFAKVIEPTYRELCYRAFAIGHSGRTRTALWSAEVLDKAHLDMASQISRDSSFKPDDHLPVSERSELDDYRRSGWDRGHLAPSADMPSREAQQESFRLSNIVPQNGSMNGGAWVDLEQRVRGEARKRKVYVVTGPIFRGSTDALKKRVLIPTAMFKAMYAVDKGAVVFIVENNEKANAYTLSVDQFTKTFGLDPFPGLQGPVRTHDIALGPLRVRKIDPNADGSAAGDSQGEGENGKGGCTNLARKRGQRTWHDMESFRRFYGRDPYPDEIDSCGSNAQ
ncbi:DNA/RNA non-specific endonuclease [Croceicoccus gelatinilyticus]|uniref:DNA/RNA non-specific endonuclease n=1 Tax=Croceicoccus gelatinilyticus TaxID=2835536 RepID=UPI001BCC8F12|nr:DNA/RNA non-specific endonuclease [Croceicoccus gelatinilyticus]MBS7671405.1 DNA/RNA non-specific endonuclease [Croceicoccus gelatinilyticus]